MNESLQRLETLFTEAVALRGAERASFLAQACAGDAELRARVEGLLRASGAVGRFLEPPLAPGVAEAAAGARIGRYKLLEKIGEGGVGMVFMAEQEEPVRRRVALKLIKPGMDTREVIARFESERQALALMDHPHIARVLDAGATDGGRPYFVMELVRGTKITDYCDQNQLSTEERLRLFLPVCGAIQHAHQKGVIHRDIKPSNILVTRHDGVAVPKVIDFGIAKATQGRLTDKTLFTSFAQFIGTPAYMSPEQAEMSGLDVDTRSDIYALGVLLYELLAGRPPFDTKELTSGGLDEVRRRIRETEPPRLSLRLNTLGADALTTTARNRRVEPPKLLLEIRGDLEWIVGRCLEKDRARRYETASALALDIQRHLDDEQVVARPPSTAYALRKLLRRYRLAFAAGAIVATGLAGSAAFSTVMFLREKTARAGEAAQRAQAEAGERKAQIEAGRSAQVTQFLKDMLRGVGDQVARGRDTKLLQELLDQTAARLGTGLTDQPEVEADVRDTLGRAYMDLGELVKSAAMHEKALMLRKTIFGADSLPVAASLNELGFVRGQRGLFKEGIAMLREALELRRKWLGFEHSDVAVTLVRLGEMISRDDKSGEGIGLVQQALAMQRRQLGDEHPVVAQTLGVLGVAYEENSRHAESEASLREALVLQVKLLGREHAATALTLSKLSLTLGRSLRRYAEAETAAREALGVQRRLLGENHPDLAESLVFVGGFCEMQGKLDEAEKLLREAWAMKLRVLGDAHHYTTVPLMRLANVLVLQGRLAEAESVVRDALAILLRSNQPQHRWHGMMRNTLVGIIARQGRFEDAEAMARSNLADASDREAAVEALADVLNRAGKYADAEAMMREKIKTLSRHRRWQLSLALVGQQKLTEAEPILRNVLESTRGYALEMSYADKVETKERAARLARLYAAAGQPEKGARWEEEFAGTVALRTP